MAEVHLGVVYGASGFEKQVALKVLLPELRGRGEFERLLIEEAKLGARLLHRNLVQIHDLGLDSGTYYVRMDYVDGADLGSLLRRERPSPELALLIVEEVALALDYVHRFADDSGRPIGLVHRDISPSNILLSRAGEVKLADFGIAKATQLAEITRGNVRKGKYAYMSPEQIERDRVTPQSDQFSVGVTLMEMCCGRRPYDGASVLETMDRIRQAEPPDLHELSPGLQGLCRRCLQREPTARFPSAEDLRQNAAQLRRFLPPVTFRDLGAWVTRLLSTPEAALVAPARPLSEEITQVEPGKVVVTL
jgi:serine/threonine-protein kinase